MRNTTPLLARALVSTIAIAVLAGCVTQPPVPKVTLSAPLQRVVIRDGRPVLLIGNPGVVSTYVERVDYRGEPALRFNALIGNCINSWGIPADLYVMKKRLLFVPVHGLPTCASGNYFLTSMDVLRNDVTDFKRVRGDPVYMIWDKYGPFDPGTTQSEGEYFLRVGGPASVPETGGIPLTPGDGGYGYAYSIRWNYSSATPEWTNAHYTTSGVEALWASDETQKELWDAVQFWIALAYSHFDAALNQFDQMTAGYFVPLSIGTNLKINAYIRNAHDAFATGNFQEALLADTQALALLPMQYADPTLEVPLRKNAITAALRMSPSPEIPAEARRHEIFSKTALVNATNPDGLNSALKQMLIAVRIAPWWADGYYNLAVIEQREHLYRQAVQSLKYYLLAAPNAPDAQAVQMKIYSLQYEATHGGL